MSHPSASDFASLSLRRDTRAWQLQVWISFGIAVFLCGTGLAWLPGQDLDRAFMIMGYGFCVSAALVLSKYVRDNQRSSVEVAADVPLWRWVVWGGFFFAMVLTGWGLVRMEISETYKAYLGVSWLFLISTSFTLAKTLRDKHEADLAEARLQGRRESRSEAGHA